MVITTASLTLLLVVGIGITTIGALSPGGLQLFSSPRVEPINFSNLVRTGKPNDYLVCPAALCNLPADRVSPVFSLPVDSLERFWGRMVGQELRMESVWNSPELHQEQFVQRTKWLGFPDTITVRFLSLPSGQSTLAVYSRSHYGYSDLGENRKRVERWLAQLEEMAADSPSGKRSR